VKKIRKKRREKFKVREIPRYKVLKLEKKNHEEPDKKSGSLKESGLEEQIEESEIIEASELHEFVNLQPENLRSAPVLEKVETREDLEENVASTPITTPINPESTNAISYASDNYLSSNYGTGGDNKYADSSMSSPILERERTADIPRQEIMNWNDIQAGTRQHTSWTEETRRVETRGVEERNEMPFENKEKKYKQFRG
jgi:hypothetical protein